MNIDQIQDMASAYIECALWSSTAYVEWNGVTDSFVPSEDNDQSFLDHNFDSDDLASETEDAMIQDCEAFYDANADDLATLDAEQVGHDFWLTRNGHGAGFWDRGLGALGNRLSDACRPYGDFNLYVGNDGKVYGE